MDVLDEAVKLLGAPVKVERHRGWAIFWCPFHDDEARRGKRGRPNFGVQLDVGYWKCLRCGASGPSLSVLQRKLGVWKPPPAATTPAPRPPRVARLNEALSEGRAALPGSPAEQYLARRGLRVYTSLTYGLGYGVPLPNVQLETMQAARQARLVAGDGHWLWAGGVVYADPPVNPAAIQVRHLRQDQDKKYQTWGRLTRPLGAWRLKASPQIVVVVEGLFDMLVFAQAIHDRRSEHTCPVFTGGASVSWAMRQWFAEHNQYGYLLIPDPDEAGVAWTKALHTAIRKGKGVCRVVQPPDGLDPDQALLQGWWPDGL